MPVLNAKIPVVLSVRGSSATSRRTSGQPAGEASPASSAPNSAPNSGRSEEVKAVYQAYLAAQGLQAAGGILAVDATSNAGGSSYNSAQSVAGAGAGQVLGPSGAGQARLCSASNIAGDCADIGMSGGCGEAAGGPMAGWLGGSGGGSGNGRGCATAAGDTGGVNRITRNGSGGSAPYQAAATVNNGNHADAAAYGQQGWENSSSSRQGSLSPTGPSANLATGMLLPGGLPLFHPPVTRTPSRLGPSRTNSNLAAPVPPGLIPLNITSPVAGGSGANSPRMPTYPGVGSPFAIHGSSPFATAQFPSQGVQGVAWDASWNGGASGPAVRQGSGMMGHNGSFSGTGASSPSGVGASGWGGWGAGSPGGSPMHSFTAGHNGHPLGAPQERVGSAPAAAAGTGEGLVWDGTSSCITRNSSASAVPSHPAAAGGGAAGAPGGVGGVPFLRGRSVSEKGPSGSFPHLAASPFAALQAMQHGMAGGQGDGGEGGVPAVVVSAGSVGSVPAGKSRLGRESTEARRSSSYGNAGASGNASSAESADVPGTFTPFLNAQQMHVRFSGVDASGVEPASRIVQQVGLEAQAGLAQGNPVGMASAFADAPHESPRLGAAAVPKNPRSPFADIQVMSEEVPAAAELNTGRSAKPVQSTREVSSAAAPAAVGASCVGSQTTDSGAAAMTPRSAAAMFSPFAASQNTAPMQSAAAPAAAGTGRPSSPFAAVQQVPEGGSVRPPVDKGVAVPAAVSATVDCKADQERERNVPSPGSWSEGLETGSKKHVTGSAAAVRPGSPYDGSAAKTRPTSPFAEASMASAHLGTGANSEPQLQNPSRPSSPFEGVAGGKQRPASPFEAASNRSRPSSPFENAVSRSRPGSPFDAPAAGSGPRSRPGSPFDQPMPSPRGDGCGGRKERRKSNLGLPPFSGYGSTTDQQQQDLHPPRPSSPFASMQQQQWGRTSPIMEATAADFAGSSSVKHAAAAAGMGAAVGGRGLLAAPIDIPAPDGESYGRQASASPPAPGSPFASVSLDNVGDLVSEMDAILRSKEVSGSSASTGSRRGSRPRQKQQQDSSSTKASPRGEGPAVGGGGDGLSPRAKPAAEGGDRVSPRDINVVEAPARAATPLSAYHSAESNASGLDPEHLSSHTSYDHQQEGFGSLPGGGSGGSSELPPSPFLASGAGGGAKAVFAAWEKTAGVSGAAADSCASVVAGVAAKGSKGGLTRGPLHEMGLESSISVGGVDGGGLLGIEARGKGGMRRKMSPLNSFVIKDDVMVATRRGLLGEEIGPATDSLTFPTFQQYQE